MTALQWRMAARFDRTVLLSLATALAAQSPEEPSRVRLSSALTTEVDFAVVVTPPYGTKVLRVWLPIPPSDGTQTVRERVLSTWPMQVAAREDTEPTYGNRFAFFEFAAPKGAQMIRHQFVAVTHDCRWRVDFAAVAAPEQWPESFAPYLRGESQAVAVNDAVRALADRLVVPGASAGSGVAAALRWVDANMRYDHGSCSLAASSQHALEHGCGHCSDYHGLTAALGRAMRVPARVAYGMNLFAKASPSHCKAELFLPPHGWVSFDVSETQKQVRAIESDVSLAPADRARAVAEVRARSERGFRDNTWLAFTRGTDYELVPKASRRVPVVRTIWAEADGVPLPEPDPGDAGKREFAWMTMHTFRADREAPYAFAGMAGLQAHPTEPVGEAPVPASGGSGGRTLRDAP